MKFKHLAVKKASNSMSMDIFEIYFQLKAKATNPITARNLCRAYFDANKQIRERTHDVHIETGFLHGIITSACSFISSSCCNMQLRSPKQPSY